VLQNCLRWRFVRADIAGLILGAGHAALVGGETRGAVARIDHRAGGQERVHERAPAIIGQRAKRWVA
jgi:hypothetical protein